MKTLDEILENFQNGERRYEQDADFKAAVNSLKAGVGVYAVLDHMLRENNSLRINLAAAQEALQISKVEYGTLLDQTEGLNAELINQNESLTAEILRLEAKVGATPKGSFKFKNN